MESTNRLMAVRGAGVQQVLNRQAMASVGVLLCSMGPKQWTLALLHMSETRALVFHRDGCWYMGPKQWTLALLHMSEIRALVSGIRSPSLAWYCLNSVQLDTSATWLLVFD